MDDGKNHIAIVGMAGRFPGARDVDAFWRLLEQGVEAIRSFTSAELELAGVSQQLIRDPAYVAANGYLDGVEFFDASFFGMTPREAEITDPQQRLFLECSWHALESAGHVPEHFDGRIGVYAGCGLSTYLLFNLFRNPNLPASVSYLQFLMGNSNDYLSTRVSYKLNLKGPSMSVNTACSSSLVAVHMASQALLDFECDMALAGGASIQLPQEQGYLYQENSIASPDGHCRAFDARAGGTVNGNGVGAVVLRRLEDALTDGDAIRAVILGSAINNDGADKAGYTAPSASGQASAIAEALSLAGIGADSIQYIETHGTGTQVGDPIEIEALSRAFGSSGRKHSCALGSVKTNIGHLDEAAGVAGLMKAVLALEHGHIPPTLHFESPNPEIDFQNGPFFVNNRLCPWPQTDGRRRAGVSSFGIGGTNAHVVLEQAPSLETPAASRPFCVVPLSARTEAELEQSRKLLADHLEANPGLNPSSVARTLQTGRRAFAQRDFVCGRTVGEIVGGLRSPRTRSGIPNRSRVVAFMFPGQGSQHPGMVAELYESESFFRAELGHCLDLVRQQAPTDALWSVTAGDEAARQSLARTDSAQPALFCVEFSLARLWMHWGLEPDFLVGHSLGEYVAACLSGVFSLEDGIRIVLARGRLMQSMPAGAMFALPLAQQDVVTRLSSQLDLAAVNGPEQVVVSGSVGEIEALEKRLIDEGVFGRRLATSHAFHSRLMEPMLGPFEEVMRSVSLSAPRIPIISNTTGQPLSRQQALDPSYWTGHVRKPVLFCASVQYLVEQDCSVLLEVGPGNTLTKMNVRLSRDMALIASLPHPRQEATDQQTLSQAVGQLWTQGVDIDWQGYGEGEQAPRIALPGYPFARERHWVDMPGSASSDSDAPVREQHAAADLDGWFYAPSWRKEKGHAADTWLPGSCLVFHDGGELEPALRDALVQAGTTVRSVQPGERFAALGDGRFTIRPDAPEDYVSLVEQYDEAPDLVLHLWSLSDAARSGRALDLGFYSLLDLTQSLTRRFINPGGRWLICSPPCYDVTGREEVAPIHAALSGIAAVIPLEFPGLICRHVDLDTGPPAQLIGQIQCEILRADSPGPVAWRDGDRWTRSWTPLHLPEPVASTAIKAAGTYLITGGLGSMGLALAEYISQQAPCRILLTGRSAFPAREQWETLLRAEASGPVDSPSRWVAFHTNGLVERVEQLEQETAQRLDLRTLDQLPDLAAAIDTLAASLVFHCLFGPLVDDQEMWSREEWQTRLSVLPRFERFFDSLLTILLEDGFVREEEGKLRFSTTTPDPMDSVLLKLTEHHSPYAGIGAMLSHCARSYADVLSGRVSPLEVLYPDGTDRLFTEHFAGLPSYTNDQVYNHAVASLIREAAQVEGAGPLRILEVGGGTGGLTQVVLEATRGVAVEYTFTDLGRSFVTRAEQEAGKRGYQNVRFQVLDISRNPLDQGFTEASYDMVLGYNVVHATPDIRATLRHLTRVLVPGGVLCLVETVSRSRVDDMIWGLTEGWWVYNDTDLRTETPILSLDQWDKALEMAALDGQTFPRSASARSATTAGLIVARKQPGAAQQPGRDDDGQTVCRSIRRIGAIEQRGSTVEYLRADAAAADDMERLRLHIRATHGALDGIVHAAGELGQGFLSQKSRQDVARTFAPKIHAAAALDDLLEEFKPSFLLLCSSMSSIAPVIGQVDYASANAFLDAYAHAANRTFDTRVGSITWGFWQELGMISKARGDLAQKRAIREQIARPGMHDAGIRAFARILENPFPAQVVVAPDGLQEPPAEGHPEHPWFDRVVRLSDDVLYLQGAVSPDSDWVLDEHEVLGRKVLPGTAYLEMAWAAAWEALEDEPTELRDVYFLQPLAMDRGQSRDVRTVLQRQGHGWDFSILSRIGPAQNDAWVEHTRGEIRAATGHREASHAPETVNVTRIAQACDQEFSERQAFEASMSAFGPHWHNLVRADFGEHQAIGEFRLPQKYLGELDQLCLHPALLDNATGFLKVKQDAGSVPFCYRTIRIYGRIPAHVFSHIRELRSDDGAISYDITVVDPDGRVLVDIEGYAMRPIRRQSRPENVALTLARRGSLSTFFLAPEPRREPAEGEVEIEVKAAGLNFIEVLYSLDMLPHGGALRFPYGLECAGIVRRCGPGVEGFNAGDEVLAFTNGCYRAFATAAVQAVAHKPKALTMEQAATIPAAYMTAWHSLTGPGRLVGGERVLIHSAAGGVGLAAVHVARLLGADVLATAGTDQKRDYLRSVGVRHVADSRQPGFGKQIMAATDNVGVDVVLNSLGQEFTAESLSVLARYGRFIELGKRAIFANAALDMRPFERQLTFAAVDVGPDLPQFAANWRDLMTHVGAGELPPLPLRAFPAADPSEGFQYMARGRHIGKIVFTFGASQELIGLASQRAGSGRSFASIVALEADNDDSTGQRRVEAPGGSEPGAAVWTEDVADVDSDLSTESEKGVARIWRDLLGTASIRRDDSFFELNGDSLLAAQVISEIHGKFGVKLPFSAIFDAATVRQLAREIDNSLNDGVRPATGTETEEGVI